LRFQCVVACYGWLATVSSSALESLFAMTVLSERQAATSLGFSVHTLRKWRRQGRGPRYVKVRGAERPGRGNAGSVRYREDDIDAFLGELTVPTSNPMPTRPN
jgi:hypothetical protein